MMLYIRIHNFKSFKGDITFCPIKDLTTVLGRSLSGKTNFAEALGFLVGMNYQQLRCARLNDLIHGFGTTRESAYVEAKLKSSKYDGGQITLQRRVHLHHEETLYFINEQEVEEDTYLEEIGNLGLSPLCLVLENKMDYFVRLSPLQRTSFIEKISGSQAMKEQYDNAVSMKEELRADFENLSQVLNMLLLKFKEMRKSSVADDNRELRALEYHKRKLQEMKLLQVEKNIALKTNALNKLLYEINVQESAKKEKQVEIENVFRKINKMLQYREILESIKTMQNEVMDYQNIVLGYKLSYTHMHKLWEKLKEEKNSLKLKNKVKTLMDDLSELEKQIKMHDYANGYNDNLISGYVQHLMNTPVDVWKQKTELEQKIIDLHWCQEDLEFICEKIEYWERKLDLTAIQQYKENVDKELQEVNQQYEDLQYIDTSDEDKQKICDLNEKIYNCEKNYINSCKRERKQRVLKHLQAVYGKSKIDCLSELWTPKEEKYKKVIEVAVGEQRDMIVVETTEIFNHVKETLREMEADEEVVSLDAITPKPTRISSRIRFFDVIPIHHLMMIKRDSLAVLNAVSNSYLCEKLNVKYRDLNNPQENVILMDGTFYEKPHIMSYTNIDFQNETLTPEEENIGSFEKEKSEALQRLNELDMKIHLKSKLQSLVAKRNWLENENRKLMHKICEIKQGDQANQKKQAKRKQRLEEEVNYNEKSEELCCSVEELMESALDNSYMLRKKCKWDFRKYHELLKKKQRMLNELEIELRNEELMKRILRNQKQLLKEYMQKVEEPTTEIMYERKRNQDLKQFITTCDNAKNNLRSLKNKKHELQEIEDELLLKNITYTATEVQFMCLKIKLNNLLVESLINGIEVNTKKQIDVMSLLDYVPEVEEVYRFVVSYKSISQQEKFDLGFEENKVNTFEEKIASNRLKRENGGTLRLKKSIEENLSTINDLKEKILSLNNKIQGLHEERKQKFMNCFEFLVKHSDKFYKELYQSKDCFATLALQNENEPYLGGVNYTVKVPGKSCVATDCLSSQENNLASCIAIIALNMYKRTPFLFIDKPDAILDPETGSMFAKFMNKKKHGHTFISPKRCMESLLPDECIGFTHKVEDGIPCTTMFVLDVTEFAP